MLRGKAEKSVQWKRKRKKGWRLILAAVFLSGCIAMMAGCGKQTEEDAEGSEEPAETISDGVEYPVLRVSMLVPMDAQPDLDDVEKEVNRVTKRQIGAEVELVPVRYSDFSDIYIQMMVEGNALDLMILPQGMNYLPEYVSNGMIQPIDASMDRAAQYLTYMMGTGLQAGVYQEKQYGIPQEINRIGVYAKGFNLSREICDRYQIKTSEIKTAEDLEEVFELVHEKEPDLTILMPETPVLGVADCLTPYYDELTVGPGSLIKESENGELEIEFLMEQEQMQQALAMVHRWYEKGFIPQNVNTTDEYGSTMLNEGTCFATASDTIGPEMGGLTYYSVVIREEKPLMTTNQEDASVWVVSSECEDPDLAVAFLNLCYKDPYISNLLYYGISGKHYTRMANGTLDISQNAGYASNWVQFGKMDHLCFTTESLEAASITKGIRTVEKLQILYREWEMEKSEAYGFFFDPASVELELTACESVAEKYDILLKNGVTDPATELEKYLQEMKHAGMDKIIAEKKRQLSAWMEEKKVEKEE